MDQRQLFLRDILAVLFKRKVLIIAFTLVVFGVVAVGNYAWPPAYESTAQLRLIRGREVAATDPTVMGSAASVAMVQMTREDVNSEIVMLRSTDVLRAVAADEETGEVLQKEGGLLRRAFRAVRNGLLEAQYALHIKTRPPEDLAAVERLREAIEVEHIKDSHVLEVRCRMSSPERAQQVLETLIEEYQKKHLEVFRSEKSEIFFTEQIERVSDELETAQAKLEAFRNENEIASLEVEKQLLLTQYTDAKKLLVQLAETASAAEDVSGQDNDAALAAALSRKTDSTVVTELQLRLLELILDRNRISQSLGPRHPEVQAVHKEIANASERLQQAVQATRAVTEAKMADIQTRIQALNRLMGELEDLERDVRINAKNYESYAQKLEESRIADKLYENQISNVKVQSAPSRPLEPVAPKKMRNLLLAIIAGLIGGLALAFFLDYLDHGLKTPEDVECYLQTPVLASFFRKRGRKLDAGEVQRLSTIVDAVAEAGPPKFIEVCSACRGEGAGRVSRALAELRAEDPETRTLYIDFSGESASSGPGLMDVVLGKSPLDEVLAADDELVVLERGKGGDCPAHLWRSKRMQDLLTELRSRFDTIVCHAAPVQLSNDALNLAPIADGVVFVIRGDSTRREVAGRAMDMIAETKGKILGAVLVDRAQPIPKAVYRRI